MRYALAIGINTYGDGDIAPLRFAEGDARAIARSLKKACAFDTHVLVGRQATRDRILDLLDRGVLRPDGPKLRPQDQFLLFFAGHGQIVDDRTYVLHAHDAILNRTDRSITMHDLSELLSERVPCRECMCVLDACRNMHMPGARDSVPLDGVSARQIQVVPRGKEHKIVEVLFGCEQQQRSWEDESLKHGVLTHFLCRVLDGPEAKQGLTFQFWAQSTADLMRGWCEKDVRNREQIPELYRPLTRRDIHLKAPGKEPSPPPPPSPHRVIAKLPAPARRLAAAEGRLHALLADGSLTTLALPPAESPKSGALTWDLQGAVTRVRWWRDRLAVTRDRVAVITDRQVLWQDAVTGEEGGRADLPRSPLAHGCVDEALWLLLPDHRVLRIDFETGEIASPVLPRGFLATRLTASGGRLFAHDRRRKPPGRVWILEPGPDGIPEARGLEIPGGRLLGFVEEEGASRLLVLSPRPNASRLSVWELSGSEPPVELSRQNLGHSFHHPPLRVPDAFVLVSDTGSVVTVPDDPAAEPREVHRLDTPLLLAPIVSGSMLALPIRQERGTTGIQALRIRKGGTVARRTWIRKLPPLEVNGVVVDGGFVFADRAGDIHLLRVS